MLAATGLTFDQKVVSTRDHFVKLAEYQLPFRQLPMVYYYYILLYIIILYILSYNYNC